MSTFLLAGPAWLAFASISDNLAPTFFLSLIGVCFVMILVGALVDRLPERPEVSEEDAAEEDKKETAKAEKRRLKLEAVVRKNRAQLERKLAKKGKTKQPAADAPPSDVSPTDTLSADAPATDAGSHEGSTAGDVASPLVEAGSTASTPAEESDELSGGDESSAPHPAP